MKSYIGILEKEPGTLWGIWFPDLVGCVAAAPTSEEVLEQVPDALSQWLELALEDGEALPKPRTIEELRNDEWVRDALAKGDVPILVVVPGEQLGFNEQFLTTLDSAASERGVTRLELIRQAVLEKVAG